MGGASEVVTLRLRGAGLFLAILTLVSAGCGARSGVTTPTPQPPTPSLPAAEATVTAATATELPAGADDQPAPTDTPAAPSQAETPASLKVSVFLANARACPTLECEVVLLLEEGTVVSVRQATSGEEVDGSSLWYEVTVEGQAEPLYLHDSVVQPAE